MTNTEFLSLIFPNPQNPPFTASFYGDPAHGDYRFNPNVSDPEANNFFCVSMLTDNRRRTPENFAALHLVVVDDVGTKIPDDLPAAVLGLPTYRLETSAGNYQWGYVFTSPVTERPVAEGIVQALCRVFTSDVAGVNRLVRLPVGTNGKPGKGNFPTELHWLGGLHDPQDIIAALDATPVTPESLLPKPFLPPDRDPVLQALRYWDPTRDPGTYRITCPWVDSHTGGRDDGTVYIAPAGFKCWHGHCAGKTFKDLREHLGISAQDIDEVIARAEFGFTAGGQPAHTGEELGGSEAPAPHPWTNATFKDLFRGGKLIPKKERDALYPRHWLFEGLIPLGSPWAIAGEGGLGKSRLGLSLCMSIATGIPLGEHFRPTEPGSVLFLTQEDDNVDRVHRFATQYERLCERNRKWCDADAVHRLEHDIFVPTLAFGQQLDAKFADSVRAFAAQRGPFKLVLFDPLVLFWDHGNEAHSINSAAGVIDTFTKLIGIARQHSEPGKWSAGMMHHMNKEGTQFYGSVMIANHVRTLFTLVPTPDPPDEASKYVTLECIKSNSTNKKGETYLFELDRETAAVYPRDALDWMTDEEKLAAMVHEEQEISVADLVKRAKERGISNPKALLGQWKGQPEKLAQHGVAFGRYGRLESKKEIL